MNDLSLFSSFKIIPDGKIIMHMHINEITGPWPVWLQHGLDYDILLGAALTILEYKLESDPIKATGYLTQRLGWVRSVLF